MTKSTIEVTEEIRQYVNNIINRTQLSNEEKYEAKQIMLYALHDIEEVILPRVGYSIGKSNNEQYSSKDDKSKKERK